MKIVKIRRVKNESDSCIPVGLCDAYAPVGGQSRSAGEIRESNENVGGTPREANRAVLDGSKNIVRIKQQEEPYATKVALESPSRVPTFLPNRTIKEQIKELISEEEEINKIKEVVRKEEGNEGINVLSELVIILKNLII